MMTKRKRKYSIIKITDFLENDETNYNWVDFALMLTDKFGDEINELLYCLSSNSGGDVLREEANEKVKKAMKLLNEVF